MGISSLLRLRRGDGWALFLSCLIGAFVARFVHDPNWSTQTYLLLSYHLFLVYLVVRRGVESKHPIPLAGGIAVHFAFVLLIVGIGFFGVHYVWFRFIRYAVAGLAVFERWFIFGPDSEFHPDPAVASTTPTLSAAAIFQPTPAAATGNCSVSGLELFQETSGPVLAPGSIKTSAPLTDTSLTGRPQISDIRFTPAAAPLLTTTADDHEAWLRYLATRNPTHRKLHLSINDEYDEWVRARVQARNTATAMREMQGSA